LGFYGEKFTKGATRTNVVFTASRVSEFGEVVAAECEFQKEGFIGGSVEFPA